MKKTIKNLIEIAEKVYDEGLYDAYDELMDEINSILSEFADTINCPFLWREIGEELAEEYEQEGRTDILDALRLWDFRD